MLQVASTLQKPQFLELQRKQRHVSILIVKDHRSCFIIVPKGYITLLLQHFHPATPLLFTMVSILFFLRLNCDASGVVWESCSSVSLQSFVTGTAFWIHSSWWSPRVTFLLSKCRISRILFAATRTYGALRDMLAEQYWSIRLGIWVIEFSLSLSSSTVMCRLAELCLRIHFQQL